MDLMNAEISLAHWVIVVVVHVPVLVLHHITRSDPRSVEARWVPYPVLPLHLGSLASSQPKIVGSSL